MQVASAGAPAVTDLADLLAGLHLVATVDEGGGPQVHVDGVVVCTLHVDHDVMAGARVVRLVEHGATLGRNHRGAALGEDVVSLMRATGCRTEDTRSRAVTVVAADREEGAVTGKRSEGLGHADLRGAGI